MSPLIHVRRVLTQRGSGSGHHINESCIKKVSGANTQIQLVSVLTRLEILQCQEHSIKSKSPMFEFSLEIFTVKWM